MFNTNFLNFFNKKKIEEKEVSKSNLENSLIAQQIKIENLEKQLENSKDKINFSKNFEELSANIINFATSKDGKLSASAIKTFFMVLFKKLPNSLKKEIIESLSKLV